MYTSFIIHEPDEKLKVLVSTIDKSKPLTTKDLPSMPRGRDHCSLT